MLGVIAGSAALLLAVSGLAKLRAPGPAAAMLAGVLPGRRLSRRILEPLVRAIALGEVAVGAAVLAAGGRLLALLLAACYLAFTVVALRLVASPGRTACGCFGRSDSTVGLPHVVLDLVGLGVAVASAVHPSGPLGGLTGHSALVASVGCAQAALLAWLGYLSISALPALAAARHPEQTP